MYTYKTEKNAAEWQKIVDAGADAVPFDIRETGEKGDFIPYQDWNPSLYGGGELWRHERSNGSFTSTGYIKVGSPVVMRVTQIPQLPDK